MNDDTEDDIPAALTRLLRQVQGVHTVYATKPIIPTIVTAVVEAVRNDPVGLHLVSVDEKDGTTDVRTSIGVTADESASVVCRRAHDAIRSYFTDRDLPVPGGIAVSVGRVG